MVEKKRASYELVGKENCARQMRSLGAARRRRQEISGQSARAELAREQGRRHDADRDEYLRRACDSAAAQAGLSRKLRSLVDALMARKKGKRQTRPVR